MTDLEMVAACAEAMGYKLRVTRYGNCYLKTDKSDRYIGRSMDKLLKIYSPLENDAHAMALVKKFKLQTATFSGGWVVIPCVRERIIVNSFDLPHDDYNRAIVECVAKMQKAKHD